MDKSKNTEQVESIYQQAKSLPQLSLEQKRKVRIKTAALALLILPGILFVGYCGVLWLYALAGGNIISIGSSSYADDWYPFVAVLFALLMLLLYAFSVRVIYKMSKDK